jgi:coenzyme F420 biosynthesis associated uncharacterized protein
MLDWRALEQAAKVVAGSGNKLDGSTLLTMRSSILQIVDEATAEVEREAGMEALPKAELLLVDRHGWLGGNIRTLERLFGDLDVKGSEAKFLAWEAGAFVGLISRAVLGQYDPFRDQLLVVYPNLGPFADAEGLRWLLFHEVTHVAQFRAAPWIPDQIVAAGRQLLTGQQSGWARDAIRQLPERIPEIVRWLRDVLEGKSTTTPLLELLPEEQREAIGRVNALVTLLEGHATHVTELIAKRVLPNYEEMNRRIAERRKRPPVMRILEALGGIEMKRQQYVLGKSFCDAVWKQGGATALEPAWRGPEWVPTMDELKAPDRWLARVGMQTPA